MKHSWLRQLGQTVLRGAPISFGRRDAGSIMQNGENALAVRKVLRRFRFVSIQGQNKFRIGIQQRGSRRFVSE